MLKATFIANKYIWIRTLALYVLRFSIFNSLNTGLS